MQLAHGVNPPSSDSQGDILPHLVLRPPPACLPGCDAPDPPPPRRLPAACTMVAKQHKADAIIESRRRRLGKSPTDMQLKKELHRAFVQVQLQ